MKIDRLDYQPFIFGYEPLSRRLVERCPLEEVRFIDVLSREGLPFFRLLNAGNQLAFGSFSMPAWVQVDCASLPSAMIGFALPRKRVEPALWNALLERVRLTFGEEAAAELGSYRGPVPVSEYCALPSYEPGVVVGFSLFSIVRGAGLGVRSKALALRCYGARRQVGVTQYGNLAVRSHCAFGPLEILSARAAPHSQPEDTFVYAVAVPRAAQLDALIASGRPEKPARAPDVVLPLARGVAAKISALQARHEKVSLIWPGLVDHAGGKALALEVR